MTPHKLVLMRCSSGHLFSGIACPVDGWMSAESSELGRALERLKADGTEASLAALHGAGLSKGALRRTVVVELPDAEAGYDALLPQSYVIEGELVALADLPRKHFR